MCLSAFSRDEAMYNAAIDGYSDAELEYFVQAFAILQRVMAETQTEALGDVYELFGMASDHMGQHFTPHTVASAAAEMQLVGADDDQDGLHIADPAAGSGRMLVWTERKLWEKGTEQERLYTAQDMDEVCAKMAVLNFALFGMDGTVLHGDSLTMEVYQGWRVRETPLGGPQIESLSDDELPESAIEN